MWENCWIRLAGRRCLTSLGVFLGDVGRGLLEVSHNGLALLGLGVVAATFFATGHDDVQVGLEQHVLNWLQQRQEAREPSQDNVLTALGEPDAAARVTATITDPDTLPRQQAAVAHWLAKRYRVAPEPISRLVQEAWEIGQRVSLDPTLILAVMGIESGFNPFAQSPVGAQGLMQVMTRLHDAKYETFGGTQAAFDPVTNLRVGVQVLRECIARGGSLEQGLRHYVGAANLEHDGGYAARVLAEQSNIRRVAQGKSVPITVGLPLFVPPSPARSGAAPSEPAPTLPVMDLADEQVALAR